MDQLISPLAWWIAPLNLPPDVYIKRTYAALLLVAQIALTFAFALVAYAENGINVTAILCLIGTLNGIFCLFLIRYVYDVKVGVRFCLGYALLFLTYLLAVGAGHGTAYCWFYLFPLSAYYVFGVREGSLWVFFSLVGAVAFSLLNLGPHTYPSNISIRFLISYAQVAILAWGLEYSRMRYYDKLMMEKLKVEDALNEVRRLQNLLPICASCKNIRDDTGYWHQVETYMRDHAGMEFSHGICPDCQAEMFASLRERKQATGRYNPSR